jgi:hypothetical protein
VPPRKTTASPASKTFTRRVRFGGGASYSVRRPGPDGRVIEVEDFAACGDEITVDALEQMRLDSLGALCPPDWTLADLEAESERRIAAYRNARRGLEAAR